MNKRFLVTLLFLVLLMYLNCIRYSFKGALPSDLKTIYIPVFDDKSPATLPEASEILSRKVINKFVDDNSLKIMNNEKDADLVLTGAITSISTQIESVGDNETVTQTKLVVKVNVECLNTHTGKPLWKQNLTENGYYDIGADEQSRQSAYEDAVELLAETILNNTIAAW